MVGDITPEHDTKLQELYRVIDNKIVNPINENNKKSLFLQHLQIPPNICITM